MATINIKTKTGKCVSRDVEKLERCYSISGNVKWYSCYRKQCDRFSKKLRTYSVLGIYSRSKVKDTCTLLFIAALYSSQKVEATKCPFIIKMWCRKNVEYSKKQWSFIQP